MAYKTQIEVFVKGAEQVARMRKRIEDLQKTIDKVGSLNGGSLAVYNQQLETTSKILNQVSQGTKLETEAVKLQARALINANDARARTNDLVDKQIKLQRALNQTEEEFFERTQASARAAAAKTAEFIRQQRIAKQLAAVLANAPAPQLLLAPGAPGGPSMSGGARRLITGPTERLGGARTPDQAAVALRFAEALEEQIRPLSQIEAIFAGITGEANRLSKVKALPSAEMLDAAARGLQRLENAEERRNRELKESADRLREIDRLEASRARRAKKLQDRADYFAGREGGGADVPRRRTRLEQFADFGLGAGFPLLFGGGAGQVAGGALGTLLGGGGPQSFGLQIAFSAIGGIVEDLIGNTRELSNNLDTLNLDNLEASAIRVNAQLKQQVENLVRAGEFEKARGAAEGAVARQTGLDPQTLKDSAGVTQGLVNSFNELLAAGGALASILGVGITAPLTLIVDFVTMIIKGANNLISIIGQILRIIPGVDLIFGLIRENSEKNNEELQKQRAKINEIIRESKVRLDLETKIAGLEGQKTLGLTQAGKLKNLELTQAQEKIKLDAKQLKDREELNEKIKAGTETQIATAQATLKAEQDLEKQQLARKQLVDLLNLKYQGQLEEIEKQSKLIEHTAELDRQRIANNEALVSAQRAGDTQALNFQSSLLQKVGATVAAQETAVKVAKLQRDATADNVKFEQQRLNLTVDISKAKEKELQAQIKQAEAQALTTPLYGEVVTKLKESLAAQQGVTELAQQSASGYAQVGAQLKVNAENLVEQQQTTLRIVEIENQKTQRLEQLNLQKETLQTNLAILQNTLAIEQERNNLAISRISLDQTLSNIRLKDFEFIKAAREAGLSELEQLKLMGVERLNSLNIEERLALVRQGSAAIAREEEELLRKQFTDKLKAAKLEYDSQLLSIDASVSKAKIEEQITQIQSQQLQVQVTSLRLQAAAIKDANARAAAFAEVNRQQALVNQQTAELGRLARNNLKTAIEQAALQGKIAKNKYEELKATIQSEELERRRSKVLSEIEAKSARIAQNTKETAEASNQISSTAGGGGLGSKTTQTVSTRNKIDPDVYKGVMDRAPAFGYRNVYKLVEELDKAQERKNARAETEQFRQNLMPGASSFASPSSYAPRASSGGGGGTASVNIKTGPVLEFDGKRYMTMDDFERGVAKLASAQAQRARSFGARRYGGIS